VGERSEMKRGDNDRVSLVSCAPPETSYKKSGRKSKKSDDYVTPWFEK
jgi:hypothetical protein